MRILFIHKNYPAQFGRLAEWLALNGWDVTFATTRKDARSETLRIVHFSEHRAPSEKIHHYLYGTESAVISGQGMARTALAMKRQGFAPDVVVAHSGWGVGVYVKDIWPQTKYVQYAEWYYNFPYADTSPYAEPVDPVDASAKARTRNAPFWLDFGAADATVCPTRFQASQFPQKIQPFITVLNDGFDTRTHCPGPRDEELLRKFDIPVKAPLVTHIARGMEPTRGFPEVMHAIEALQKRHSDLHAVIVADDRVAYGAKKKGFSWKEHMLARLDLDLQRLHFTGLVPRRTMVDVLRCSHAHLYLSVPFVLSWSFVEAMTCAAPIVGTRSAPVEAFMQDGKSGLLVDPFNTPEVASAVDRLIGDQEFARSLGHAARDTVTSKYDGENIVYPATAAFYAALVDQLGAGSRTIQAMLPHGSTTSGQERTKP